MRIFSSISAQNFFCSMKNTKLLLCIAFSAVFFDFISIHSLSAQTGEKITQVLIPMEIYVGDQAELHFNFRTALTIFPGNGRKENSGSERTQLHIEGSSLVSSSACTVEKAVLTRNGLEYSLILTLVPWRTGSIDLPEFDLTKLIGNESDRKDSRSVFMIDPQPFVVQSILEKNHSEQLRPISPPILVPGTTYVVYATAIVCVLVIILVLYLLVHLKRLHAGWQQFRGYIALSRNAHLAFRKVGKLKKAGNKLDDATYCAELQKIIRQYLSFRFDFCFESLPTSEIETEIIRITGDTLSFAQSVHIQKLTEILRRSDYIRFARNSIDSRRLPPSFYAAVLNDGERGSLVDSVKNVIRAFEGNYSVRKEEQSV